MSFRILSIPIQSACPRPNTQRKIGKYQKKRHDKYIIENKIRKLKIKKSHSTIHRPPKQKNQRQINQSKVNEINKQSHKDKNFKNKKIKSMKNVNRIQVPTELSDFQNLAEKILQVSKNIKAIHQQTKIKRLQQKFVEFVENLNLELEIQKDFIKNLGEKRYNPINLRIKDGDCRKPTPSLYLRLKNFQYSIMFEDPKVINRIKQSKGYSCLRMIKKIKGSDEEKVHKRKRIESCKFVINPFRNLEVQTKKIIKPINCCQEENKNKIQQLRRQIQTNQISQIQKLIKSEDTQIESLSISILELMDW